MSTHDQPDSIPAPARGMKALPYVLPMLAFAAVTMLEGQAKAYYVWIYIFKVLIVCGLLAAGYSTWKSEVRPNIRALPLGLVVGLLVLAEWVLLDPYYRHMGARVAYNPFTAIPDPTVRTLFLVFRFFGLALMVPIMEELFWRSFLLRWITQQDFERLPVGTFSASAFWIVAVAFGLVHTEWLAGIICGIAYGALMWRTRSLFACIVAHAVTNLGLGIYIVLQHQWKFW